MNAYRMINEAPRIEKMGGGGGERMQILYLRSMFLSLKNGCLTMDTVQ